MTERGPSILDVFAKYSDRRGTTRGPRRYKKPYGLRIAKKKIHPKERRRAEKLRRQNPLLRPFAPQFQTHGIEDLADMATPPPGVGTLPTGDAPAAPVGVGSPSPPEPPVTFDLSEMVDDLIDPTIPAQTPPANGFLNTPPSPIPPAPTAPTAPTVPLGPSSTPPPSHQVPSPKTSTPIPPPRKKKKKSPRQEAMDKLFHGGLEPGEAEKLMDKFGINPLDVFIHEAGQGRRRQFEEPTTKLDAIEELLRGGLPPGKAREWVLKFFITGMDLFDYISTAPPLRPFKSPTTAEEALALILRQGLPPGKTKQWAQKFQLTDEDLLDYAATYATRVRDDDDDGDDDDDDGDGRKKKKKKVPPKKPPKKPPPPPPPGGGGDSPGGSPGWSPGGSSSSGGSGRRPNRFNQEELRRQLDLLAEDQRQRAIGRRISGITHTNTITTVYKDTGKPTVQRTSSRISNP